MANSPEQDILGEQRGAYDTTGTPKPPPLPSTQQDSLSRHIDMGLA
jgi:hypothetical protein